MKDLGSSILTRLKKQAQETRLNYMKMLNLKVKKLISIMYILMRMKACLLSADVNVFK